MTTEHKPWPGHGCELFASKIREALDAEDWEDADPNVDSYGQERRLYLGTVFGCMPSGKFYTPFACSNVMGCDSCGGSGMIANHRKRRITKKRSARFKRAYNRPRWYRLNVTPMRHKAGTQAYRSCTACGGLGSREGHLDGLWSDYAASVCESVGACLVNGEGDPCDLFITEYRDTPDEDETEEGDADVSESQPA